MRLGRLRFANEDVVDRAQRVWGKDEEEDDLQVGKGEILRLRREGRGDFWRAKLPAITGFATGTTVDEGATGQGSGMRKDRGWKTYLPSRSLCAFG